MPASSSVRGSSSSPSNAMRVPLRNLVRRPLRPTRVIGSVVKPASQFLTAVSPGDSNEIRIIMVATRRRFGLGFYGLRRVMAGRARRSSRWYFQGPCETSFRSPERRKPGSRCPASEGGAGRGADGRKFVPAPRGRENDCIDGPLEADGPTHSTARFNCLASSLLLSSLSRSLKYGLVCLFPRMNST